jgi:isopenicillin-N N-acyltransferase like protein
MTWFKNFFSGLSLMLLLLFTFLLASFHAAVAKKPLHLVGQTAKESGVFIDKSKYGIHQLVLSGSDFERGYNAGRLGAGLLQKQEVALFTQLEGWIPSHAVLKLLTAVAANWFRGIQDHYEPWALEEMYGVSLHAPKEGDFLADGFTRQIGYHGLHEVGQMLVDQGVPFACTAVAVKNQDSWIIGRNFDFEGGEVFDREKLMKWVFPDKGNPYLSVIWAGMVGATTGVNSNGLYISLNAAGSDDFARIGTPSTLLITKALQFSKNIEEALEIFKNEKMFITDIFVLADAQSNRVFRIEKSPDRTIVDEVTAPTVIANHLDSEAFKNDETNRFREQELTSTYRQTRGLQLLKELKPESAATSSEAVSKVLKILRDKGQEGNKPLHLNNRRAIDALISAHSVIYDAKSRVLYVSQGPSLAGAYTGFDLEKSFATQTPVTRGELPRDPLVSDETYANVRFSEKTAWQAQSEVRKRNCPLAKSLLAQAGARFNGSSLYHQVAGDIAFTCDSEVARAKDEWTQALNLYPAYARDVRALRESLYHAN